MALILICIGCLIGTAAAVVQWVWLGASGLQAVATYFAVGFGLPLLAWAFGWVGNRLRSHAARSENRVLSGGES